MKPGGGTLFVVATPLGNQGDLSPRAAATLREADVVIAEDTRTARRLLADIGGAAAADRPVLSVGSSRVDLQACKLEYSIVSPK